MPRLTGCILRSSFQFINLPTSLLHSFSTPIYITLHSLRSLCCTSTILLCSLGIRLSYSLSQYIHRITLKAPLAPNNKLALTKTLLSSTPRRVLYVLSKHYILDISNLHRLIVSLLFDRISRQLLAHNGGHFAHLGFTSNVSIRMGRRRSTQLDGAYRTIAI
jgi:hypothetical protein